MNKLQSVLNHLIKHGSITSWEAIVNYRATRLSAIIYTLRARDYRIESTMVTEKGTTFARYTLLKDET